MGITVQWLDDLPDIQYFRFVDPWTVDDLVTAIDTAYDMSQNKETFDIIYDLTDGKNFPRSILSATSYLQERTQPQVNTRIIVGASNFMRTFLHILKALLPMIDPFHFAATLDDAIDYLRAR
jgi:hypothetical protein